MEHCVDALEEIAGRMESGYGVQIELVNVSYPVTHNGVAAGYVNIASVGPFFYTNAQSAFLDSLNRLLAAAALVFLLFSVVMSIILAEEISRPIRTAGRAARTIAAFYAQNTTHGALNVRIHEKYTTTELTELAQSINELGRELAEGERRQKQLMNDIAHELRTPLTCLRGTLEAIADGVWEAAPDRLANCLDEVRRLSTMLDDIMLLTRLEWENITLHRTTFDIAGLINETAEQFACAAAEKDITLTAHTVPANVYADYDRIKQVVINLVSNALRYTDSGRITLSVEPAGQAPTAGQAATAGQAPTAGQATTTGQAAKSEQAAKSGQDKVAEEGAPPVTIKVADTGCGIAASGLPRIFERFYRADKSRNRNSGGLGVGLSIAAAIVAAHGWEIAAESTPGEGSVFTVIVRQ